MRDIIKRQLEILDEEYIGKSMPVFNVKSTEVVYLPVDKSGLVSIMLANNEIGLFSQ
jgi:hypothetical protein